MEQYVGLDVSLELTSVCVVDNDGKTLWQGKCTARSKAAPCHAPNRHLITLQIGIATRCKPAPDHGANRHRITA